MINKEMNDNKSQNSNKNQSGNGSVKPNEQAGFYFSSSVKIFDPNSKQVIVQKRGDN